MRDGRSLDGVVASQLCQSTQHRLLPARSLDSTVRGQNRLQNSRRALRRCHFIIVVPVHQRRPKKRILKDWDVRPPASVSRLRLPFAAVRIPR